MRRVEQTSGNSFEHTNKKNSLTSTKQGRPRFKENMRNTETEKSLQSFKREASHILFEH